MVQNNDVPKTYYLATACTWIWLVMDTPTLLFLDSNRVIYSATVEYTKIRVRTKLVQTSMFMANAHNLVQYKKVPKIYYLATAHILIWLGLDSGICLRVTMWIVAE